MGDQWMVVWLVVLAIFVMFFFYLVPFRLFLAARFARVQISISALIGMRIRRVPPAVIVNSLIVGYKAGLTLDSNDLEAHYLAGGNVYSVVNALVSADKANIPLNFQRAAAIDLAGRDIVEAVHTSVNPRVIDCPSQESGTPMLDAVAKDGIRLSGEGESDRPRQPRPAGWRRHGRDHHRPCRPRHRQRHRLRRQLQGGFGEPRQYFPESLGKRPRLANRFRDRFHRHRRRQRCWDGHRRERWCALGDGTSRG